MPFTNIPSNQVSSILNQRSSPSTPTTTTASITASDISSAKDRIMLTIFNESNGILLIRFGGVAANTTNNFHMRIFPNTIYEYPAPTLPPNTLISGIWIAPSIGSLSGNCTVFEMV